MIGSLLKGLFLLPSCFISFYSGLANSPQKSIKRSFSAPEYVANYYGGTDYVGFASILFTMNNFTSMQGYRYFSYFGFDTDLSIQGSDSYNAYFGSGTAPDYDRLINENNNAIRTYNCFDFDNCGCIFTWVDSDNYVYMIPTFFVNRNVTSEVFPDVTKINTCRFNVVSYNSNGSFDVFYAGGWSQISTVGANELTYDFPLGTYNFQSVGGYTAFRFKGYSSFFIRLQFLHVYEEESNYNAGYDYGYGKGYDEGYGNGLQEGNQQGYQEGYQAGLDLSGNANFNSLMAAIADTPIRMLYSLFSFDLFGTSMLSVILSLLTGIIIFGIVKKFIL